MVDDWVADRDLVFEFFAVFSRFEYALKRDGFLRTSQHGQAQPDWNKYGATLRGRFCGVRCRRFQDACKYLKTKPPKKQIVDHSSLGWQGNPKGPSESDEQYILRLVRTVRNNLFHGGKHPCPNDTARNNKLLDVSLIVLQACLDLSPEVQNSFARRPSIRRSKG